MAIFVDSLRTCFGVLLGTSGLIAIVWVQFGTLDAVLLEPRRSLSLRSVIDVFCFTGITFPCGTLPLGRARLGRIFRTSTGRLILAAVPLRACQFTGRHPSVPLPPNLLVAVHMSSRLPSLNLTIRGHANLHRRPIRCSDRQYLTPPLSLHACPQQLALTLECM